MDFRAKNKVERWFPLFLFVVGFISYLPAIASDFIFDDFLQIAQLSFFGNKFDPAPRVEFQQGLFHVLQTIIPDRPFLMITIWLNYLMSGGNPISYKITNIFLHCGNAVLLWAFLQKYARMLGREIPLLLISFLALVFLLHPLNNQAVTVVIQRGALLSAGFGLAAVYCALLYFQEGERRYFLSAVLCSLLSILSKQNTVILPLLLLVLALPVRKKIRIFPLILTMVGVSFLPAVFYFFLKENVHRETFLLGAWVNYGLVESRVVFHYLRQVFFPNDLNVYYPIPEVATFRDVWFYCLMHLGLLGFAAFKASKRSVFGIGILAFYVALIPESSVFPIPHVVFDHRMYFPFFFLALSAVSLPNPKQKIILPLALIVAVLGGLNFYRNVEVSSYYKWLYSSSMKFKKSDQLVAEFLKYFIATANYADGLRYAKEFAAANPGVKDYEIYIKIFSEPQTSYEYAVDALLRPDFSLITPDTRVGLYNYAIDTINKRYYDPQSQLKQHEELVALCIPQLRHLISQARKIWYWPLAKGCFSEFISLHEIYLGDVKLAPVKPYQEELWLSILTYWNEGVGTPAKNVLKLEEVPQWIRFRYRYEHR
jgi:hypothetical protein